MSDGCELEYGFRIYLLNNPGFGERMVDRALSARPKLMFSELERAGRFELGIDCGELL